MATAPALIPIADYLNTFYSPDCEYVDGFILERNVGQGKHSWTQLNLGSKLLEQSRRKKLIALSEQRTRVSPTRIRIPDLCVVERLEEVTTKPPLLCVEVLSPDDRWNRIHACIADYQAMGVPCIWVVNPYDGRAWIFELDDPPAEVRDGKLRARALEIEIALADVLPDPSSEQQ